MNSRSDRESSTPEYTMDELKARNRRDLLTAGECETRVTLTEKNWSAVVSLLTKAPETKRVEDIFSCYNRAVTVQAKHSIEM